MPFQELTKQAALASTRRSAFFSKDRCHRYTLTIQWHRYKDSINFLMLNPSTADETANDPTVERCERRARMWGYGQVIITNLFSFRATDPALMLAAPDKTGGSRNDQAILAAAKGSSVVLCAWGRHGSVSHRSTQVVHMLVKAGLEDRLLCLKQTTGEPWHPLYLPYTAMPKSLDMSRYV